MRAAILIVLLACMPAHARTLTIGLDVSGSAPLSVSESFAKLAAQRAYQEIAALELGDVVIVKRFGDRSSGNLDTLTIQISRRTRPREAAQAIAALIEAIPKSGIDTQPYTNIIAFLEFGSFECDQGGHVLLITDGLESSQSVNEKSLLAGQTHLPAPAKDALAGCMVTMFGIGAGGQQAMSVSHVKILRHEWSIWMDKAGAEFSAIILQ